MKLLFSSALLAMVSCSENKIQDDFNGSAADSYLKAPSKALTVYNFSVLSCNVAGLPQILSSATNRDLYTPIIGQKVRDYDIVNVQEDFNYHAALYANDNHLYRTATTGGAGIGSGLNTMSNFPFSDDIDRVKWTDNSGTDGNNLTPKGFTWLRIRMSEGVYIDVYNIHTGAGDVDAALDARRKNIDQIVAYIKANSDGNAVLIFGDTNCRYSRLGDNIRNIISGLGATDSWVKLIKNGLAPELGSAALVCDDMATILTSFDCEVVDKIFYRGNNYINLSALAYTVEDAKFRYTDGSPLSDHRPVYTKFQYTLNSALRLSDQFGGPHGTSYNDVNSIPSSPMVSKIGIRAASRVDQISISLTNGQTFTHGGTGGTANSLTMNTGEYVKSVSICSDKYNGSTRIFYIKYTTSAGRTLVGGSTTSSSVTYAAPAGWQIVGFHGRSGDALDKMGVIYAPIN